MPEFRNLTRYMERHLISPTSGTTLTEWYTNWMCVDGVDNIRAVLKSKNATSSNFSYALAVQYAPVRPDEPAGQASAIGNGQTGSVEYSSGDISIATSSAANRLFRLGIAYQSLTASVQQADVGLQVSWKQVGTDLGTRSLTLGLSDNNTRYEALTPWMPSTIMSKIKAAFSVNSINPANGNFKYKLAYQTASTIITQPAAWVDAEVNFTQPGNLVTFSERNTGEITLTTTDMWFRLGVGYAQGGGVDANYTAALTAICACR